MKKILFIILILSFIAAQTSFSKVSGSYWNLVNGKLVPIKSTWKTNFSMVDGLGTAARMDSVWIKSLFGLRLSISDSSSTPGTGKYYTPTMAATKLSISDSSSTPGLAGKYYTPTMAAVGGSGSSALIAKLTSDFTTASTSAVDVTGLTLAVAANTTYFFDFSFYMTMTGSVDYGLVKFVYPSGATFFVDGIAIAVESSPIYSRFVQTGYFDCTFNNIGYAKCSGFFTTSATAGNLKLQAYVITNGTLTVVANSYFVLIK